MLIHSVYFWFKADADAAKVADFEAGLRKLTSIEHVLQSYIGGPERTTPRPVIDQSYAWALIVHFANLAAHDAYQDHPLHHEFLRLYSDTWATVRVYDSNVTSGGAT